MEYGPVLYYTINIFRDLNQLYDKTTYVKDFPEFNLTRVRTFLNFMEYIYFRTKYHTNLQLMYTDIIS